MGFWQYAVSPRRQASQVPSSPPKNPTPTRWSTFHAVTPGPTSSIRPTTSWPGTRGKERLGNCASTVATSEWHTPQASTRIRTCPAPGTTTFLSTKEKTPGEEISQALYVLCMPILQVHIPPNRNDSILSASLSLTSRSLPANATCASARARFYTAPLNLGPRAQWFYMLCSWKPSAFELTVGV